MTYDRKILLQRASERSLVLPEDRWPYDRARRMSYHMLVDAASGGIIDMDAPQCAPQDKPKSAPRIALKFFLAIVALFALTFTGIASADPAMRAECELQMARGVCLVQLDRSDYPAAATHLFINGRRVLIDAMLTLRTTDNSMCRIGELACQAGASGTALQKDICHVARARWGAR
jgi:hypothetical protein